MKMKAELVAAAAEETPVAGLKEFTESFLKKETGQQKTDKKLPAPPAPFYDELHFADYE